jgi:hypothetical protein
LKLSSYIVGNVGRLFQCRLSCFCPQKPNPHMSNFCKTRNIWWSITTSVESFHIIWGCFPSSSHLQAPKTFHKCGARLGYCLILSPLFWECPHPRALPYTYDLCKDQSIGPYKFVSVMFFLNEKAIVFLDKCEGSTLRSFLDLRLQWWGWQAECYDRQKSRKVKEGLNVDPSPIPSGLG